MYIIINTLHKGDDVDYDNNNNNNNNNNKRLRATTTVFAHYGVKYTVLAEYCNALLYDRTSHLLQFAEHYYSHPCDVLHLQRLYTFNRAYNNYTQQHKPTKFNGF